MGDSGVARTDRAGRTSTALPVDGVGVFVSGLLFHDLVLTGLDRPPKPGTETWTTRMGAGPRGIANFAVTLARLGRALHAWAGRITQVHVKDARHDLHEQARADEADLTELVRRGGFCALGEGDLDVPAFARALADTGYTGWVVIEQDAPATGQDQDTILADQRANRELLRKAGL